MQVGGDIDRKPRLANAATTQLIAHLGWRKILQQQGELAAVFVDFGGETARRAYWRAGRDLTIETDFALVRSG